MQHSVLIKLYYHPLGRSNPATGGTCSYECKNTGACSVTLKPNGSYSGGIKGSCTSEEFGWSGDCSGTPRFCTDCKLPCLGRWGTNFSEISSGVQHIEQIDPCANDPSVDDPLCDCEPYYDDIYAPNGECSCTCSK